jgi:hypothetical protein
LRALGSAPALRGGRGLFRTFAVVVLAAKFVSGQILIDTVAGGKLRSGVPALGVILGSIQGITKDAAGNIVFCEDHVIRRVRTDGTVETVAGTGTSAYGGDGGQASAASLFWPRSPRFDSNGNLFFIDEDNFRIRRIEPSGLITTVAGTGQVGTLGANGAATAAQISFAADLAVDRSGSVYLSFEGYYGNQIKRLTPAGRLNHTRLWISPESPQTVMAGRRSMPMFVLQVLWHSTELATFLWASLIASVASLPTGRSTRLLEAAARWKALVMEGRQPPQLFEVFSASHRTLLGTFMWLTSI